MPPESRPNLKQMIHSGQSILFAQMRLTNASDADRRKENLDFIAQQGYLGLWTSTQHAAYNDDDIAYLAEDCRGRGLNLIVRARDTSLAVSLYHILDLGPDGTVVPQVESVDTVRQAINSFYYPSQEAGILTGKRSQGSDRRAGEPGELGYWYGDWWNKFGHLGIQLESDAAFLSVSELAIPGVDYVDIGPNDLRSNVGYLIATGKRHSGIPIKTVEEAHRVNMVHWIDLAVKATRALPHHVAVAIRDYDRPLPGENLSPEQISERRLAGRHIFAEIGATIFFENPSLPRK